MAGSEKSPPGYNEAVNLEMMEEGTKSAAHFPSAPSAGPGFIGQLPDSLYATQFPERLNFVAGGIGFERGISNSFFFRDITDCLIFNGTTTDSKDSIEIKNDSGRTVLSISLTSVPQSHDTAAEDLYEFSLSSESRDVGEISIKINPDGSCGTITIKNTLHGYNQNYLVRSEGVEDILISTGSQTDGRPFCKLHVPRPSATFMVSQQPGRANTYARGYDYGTLFNASLSFPPGFSDITGIDKWFSLALATAYMVRRNKIIYKNAVKKRKKLMFFIFLPFGIAVIFGAIMILKLILS